MNRVLKGFVTILFILVMGKVVCATSVNWELTFDSSVLSVGGNKYVFAVDTDAKATQTNEYRNPNTVTFRNSPLFYAEYVSKNGIEKGFNYLTYRTEDNYALDWNIGLMQTPTWLHIETLEDYDNCLFLNLHFDSTDFGTDYSQATSVYISEFDGGIRYFANVSNDLFVLKSLTPIVPEPATVLLFGMGLAGVVGLRIRRKKKIQLI